MHNRHLHIGRWLATCLALLGLSGLVISASVVFSEFKATRQADGSILVAWKTATELNSAAFNLYRAAEATFPLDEAHRIHQEPAAGSDTGAEYAYLDTATQPGVCYYYLIAELTFAGSIGSIAGPIAAGDGCPAVTPTATGTPTVTPTATGTSTAPPTASPTPTGTRLYLPLIMH